jgi:hypothetical protein
MKGILSVVAVLLAAMAVASPVPEPNIEADIEIPEALNTLKNRATNATAAQLFAKEDGQPACRGYLELCNPDGEPRCCPPYKCLWKRPPGGLVHKCQYKWS